MGNFPISIETPEEDLDWGIKDWVPYIFDLLMDGDSLSSELLLRYMLNSPSKNQNNPVTLNPKPGTLRPRPAAQT